MWNTPDVLLDNLQLILSDGEFPFAFIKRELTVTIDLKFFMQLFETF